MIQNKLMPHQMVIVIAINVRLMFAKLNVPKAFHIELLMILTLVVIIVLILMALGLKDNGLESIEICL
jgi:hypothetical protein